MFTNLNINNLSLRKSIVRVALALILALVILVASMQISIWMTKSRMDEYAKNDSEQRSARANTITSMIYMSNEWVLNNFIAGMSDLDIYADSTSESLRYRHVFSDVTLKKLTVDDIYARLNSFINYNQEFSSVVMVFEPGVLEESPDGIAAMVHLNDTTRYNLLNDRKPFDTKLYNMVKSSTQTIFLAGHTLADSTFVLTSGVSLYDKNRNFIGEFWVDTDVMFFSNILKQFNTDDVDFTAMIRNDLKIISSTNVDDIDKNLKDILFTLCDCSFPDEWLLEVKERTSNVSYSHFKSKIGKDDIFTYVFPILDSDYSLLVVKPSKLLFGETTRFMWISILIMFICVLLIFGCLLYIYHIFKKKNDENSRMENELGLAAEIQRGILPPNSKNNDNQLFDIYGFQRQAKSVGGDLYDFVRKGDLLHFCVGDVSGKGMPAALVMTELCSLYRYIICYHSDPQEIVTLINKAVMERSDDSMLCTLFVGVLNLKTGLLEFCNAGHNPPIYLCKENSEVKYLKIKPNMPIYAFENYVYQKESIQLNHGDRLFAYTDGITEAKNVNNDFYGEKATLAIVERLGENTFKTLIDGVLKDLKSFTRKAEQNDDITILCVEYKGEDNCVSLHYDNIKTNITKIVDDVLEACSMTEDMRLRLAVEEPVQNIADYAYETDGAIDVNVIKIIDENAIEITLMDNGKPFNPLECKLPDLTVPVEQRQIGGLGIMLTRKIMEDVSYQYVNNKNILILKYKIK